jgi:hypothetical protein
MSERDALQEDTDRKHGEHILEVVAAQEDRRQGRAEDPLLEVLHQAQTEDKQE